jgi:hypothetical protein
MESLQVEGELGTLFNESEYSEPPLWLLRGAASKVDLTSEVGVRDSAGQYTSADIAILRNFRAAIIEGEPLISPARDNLATLSVVEGARECFRHRRAVNPQELLAAACR